MELIPDQEESQFFKQIELVPLITDSQFYDLVKKYGKEKVLAACILKMRELESRVAELSEEVQDYRGKIDKRNHIILGSYITELLVSLGLSEHGLKGKISQGHLTDPLDPWGPFINSVSLKLAKSIEGARNDDRLISIVLSFVNEKPLAAKSIYTALLGVGLKTLRYYQEDARGVDLVKQNNKVVKIELLAQLCAGFAQKINLISGSNPPKELEIIKGYYSLNDRPLTEIFDLAVKAMDNLYEQTNGGHAMIVADNYFRAELLLRQVLMKGVEAKLSTSKRDPLKEAINSGAGVMLAIKEEDQEIIKNTSRTTTISDTGPDTTTTIKGYVEGIPPASSNKTTILSTTTTPPTSWIILRTTTIPFRPFTTSTIPTQWELERRLKLWRWDRFMPPSPKIDLPFGVSTEDIALTIVDKGGWPVLTTYGLNYNTSGFFK